MNIRVLVAAGFFLCSMSLSSLDAQISSWIGSSGDNDFGNFSFWSMNVPNQNSIAAIGPSIEAKNSSVNLDQDRILGGMLITDGMWFDNFGHALEIQNLNGGGLSVAGSNLIDGQERPTKVSIYNVDQMGLCVDMSVQGNANILSGAALELFDAEVSISDQLLLDAESSLEVFGQGSIFATEVSNSGIFRTNTLAFLSINTLEATEHVFDLDGDSESGILDASAANSQIRFEGLELADPFDGQIQIGPGSLYDVSSQGSDFEIGSGTVIFNGTVQSRGTFRTNGLIDSGFTQSNVVVDGHGEFQGFDTLGLFGDVNIVLTPGSTLNLDQIDSLLTGTWLVGDGATLEFNDSDMYSEAVEVTLNGGQVLTNSEATFINNSPAGIVGSGLFELPLRNDSKIEASGGLLVVDGLGHNNDWDGINDVGQLLAVDGSMHLLDVGGAEINGLVQVGPNQEIYFGNTTVIYNGIVELTSGSIRSDNTLFFNNELSIGGNSAIDARVNFTNIADINLQGELNLLGTASLFTSGVSVSGSGSINNSPIGNLLFAGDVQLNVDLTNQGTMGMDQQSVYNLTINGDFENQNKVVFGIQGTGQGEFSRIAVDGEIAAGNSVFAAMLLDEYSPLPGDEFDVLDFVAFQANGVSFELPALWPGLVWDTTDFVSEGILRIGGFLLGDVNLDGSVDLLDVAPFVDLISAGEYQAEADINQDGEVDLLDVALFVDLISA